MGIVSAFLGELLAHLIDDERDAAFGQGRHPSGLACTLSLPHCEGLKLGNGRGLPKRTDRNTRDLSHLEAGSAVLLVEDESMVAMMVEETLAELGFCVIGPCGTLAEAMRAASSAHLDAAILDINLGGQLVYPVADLLCSKGVPVVFVTGYGMESIETRYTDIPLLQKPLDRRTLQDLFDTSGNLGPVRDGRAVPSKSRRAVMSVAGHPAPKI